MPTPTSRPSPALGKTAFPDVASLPSCPDLAVVCTPPDAVPEIVAELAGGGTKAAVVITAGFGERQDERGEQLQQALLDAARPALLRVVGPNCLGIMVPAMGLNASFAQFAPKPGHLAFVAQSGAIVTSVLDWAQPQAIGFSHLVSLGDMADVDFGDMLDYLANDVGTRAILLYIEAVTHARKFMSAARAAARMKPVLVVKAGRFTQIDYDREMALVLTQHGIPGDTPMYGVVRIGADPDNQQAEYAIIVDREMTGMGLGIVLMRRIIDYAESRGIKEIVRDVLRENVTMLKLCEAFGFTISRVHDAPELVRVSKLLLLPPRTAAPDH